MGYIAVAPFPRIAKLPLLVSSINRALRFAIDCFNLCAVRLARFDSAATAAVAAAAFLSPASALDTLAARYDFD